MSHTVNLPHLMNAMKKVTRETNDAVRRCFGADPCIDVTFSVSPRRGVVLVLSAEGVPDHVIDAPHLDDNYSGPLAEALQDPKTLAWLRAVGGVARALATPM